MNNDEKTRKPLGWRVRVDLVRQVEAHAKLLQEPKRYVLEKAIETYLDRNKK
jgi:predicted transcriptional regulator